MDDAELIEQAWAERGPGIYCGRKCEKCVADVLRRWKEKNEC